MDARQLQEKLQTAPWHLRVGPHTAQYILDKLTKPKPAAFQVLAADARTGRPLAQTLDPQDLSDPQPLLF